MRSGLSIPLARRRSRPCAHSRAGRPAGPPAWCCWRSVAFALAALGTWNVDDPSFSHATDNLVTNAMGYPGAVFSDLAMQFFGLSSVAALVPAVIWGFLLASGRGVDRHGQARRRLVRRSASVRGDCRLHDPAAHLAAADRARRRLRRHGAENSGAADRRLPEGLFRRSWSFCCSRRRPRWCCLPTAPA